MQAFSDVLIAVVQLSRHLCPRHAVHVVGEEQGGESVVLDPGNDSDGLGPDIVKPSELVVDLCGQRGKALPAAYLPARTSAASRTVPSRDGGLGVKRPCPEPAELPDPVFLVSDSHETAPGPAHLLVFRSHPHPPL